VIIIISGVVVVRLWLVKKRALFPRLYFITQRAMSTSTTRLIANRASRITMHRDGRSSSRCRRRRHPNVVVRAKSSSLADEVSAALKGISIVVVGDDERANDAVARSLAKHLGYSPVSVPALIASSVESGAVESEESDETLSEEARALLLENGAHEQLSTYLRLCVATAGGGRGATARGDCWTWLFGSVTVWVDLEGADESAPQREAYELSEVRVVVKDGASLDDEETTGQVLAGIKALVEADDQLCGKKNLYVRFGCRGDWPDLQPPGEYAGDASAAANNAQQS
jgi:hypothetical protein